MSGFFLHIKCGGRRQAHSGETEVARHTWASAPPPTAAPRTSAPAVLSASWLASRCHSPRAQKERRAFPRLKGEGAQGTRRGARDRLLRPRRPAIAGAAAKRTRTGGRSALPLARPPRRARPHYPPRGEGPGVATWLPPHLLGSPPLPFAALRLHPLSQPLPLAPPSLPPCVRVRQPRPRAALWPRPWPRPSSAGAGMLSWGTCTSAAGNA